MDELSMLSEEERNELLADIGEVVFDAVMRRVWDALDADGQDELTKLFEASSDDPENDEKRERIDTFLKERVPDFERFVQEETEKLRAAEEKIRGELNP